VNLAILQARMSSSRLPGKVMAPVLGAPMIGRQVERLRHAKAIDKLVVATSSDPTDDPLAAYCDSQGLAVFRGSLNDVLGRFAGAMAQYLEAKVVIRLTADCPLTDPSVIDAVVERHLSSGADYTSNTAVRTFPHGLDVEVVRASVLLDAWQEAQDAYDREHVTPFIYHRPERFHLEGVERAPSLAHLRWTVDVPEDLEFVRDVYARLYPSHPTFETEVIAGLAWNSSRAIP
jgi:spore coat polysaccharide biosynthesis protein SpsF